MLFSTFFQAFLEKGATTLMVPWSNDDPGLDVFLMPPLATLPNISFPSIGKQYRISPAFGGPDRKIESGKIEPSALLFWYLTFLQYEQPKLGGVCYLFSRSRTPERSWCGSCIRLVADEDLSRNRNSRLSIFPFPTMHWLDTHIRDRASFPAQDQHHTFFGPYFIHVFALDK